MNIFVYGTLKKAYQHLNAHTNAFHQGTLFIGNASISGKLYKISWYPAYKEEGNDPVYGEIYEIISLDLLRHLDFYEGAVTESEYFQKINAGEPVQADYVRKEIIINNIKCWLYIYIQEVDDALRIHSGNFIL